MPSTCKEDLRAAGFCIARNRFDQATLERIGRLCEVALESVTENHRKMFKAQGSLVDILDYPDFAEIIAHPALAALFDELELGGHVFSSGAVVSKPPAAHRCSGTRTGGDGTTRARIRSASPRST